MQRNAGPEATGDAVGQRSCGADGHGDAPIGGREEETLLRQQADRRFRTAEAPRDGRNRASLREGEAHGGSRRPRPVPSGAPSATAAPHRNSEPPKATPDGRNGDPGGKGNLPERHAVEVRGSQRAIVHGKTLWWWLVRRRGDEGLSPHAAALPWEEACRAWRMSRWPARCR